MIVDKVSLQEARALYEYIGFINRLAARGAIRITPRTTIRTTPIVKSATKVTIAAAPQHIEEEPRGQKRRASHVAEDATVTLSDDDEGSDVVSAASILCKASGAKTEKVVSRGRKPRTEKSDTSKSTTSASRGY